jgi:cell division protein ZapA
MGQVIIAVNDRSYTMQCADGEEAQLSTLAGVLDKEVSQIRDQVGAVGDLRLLLMAGLMLADKLAESERRAEAMREQIEGLRQSRSEALHQGRSLEEDLADRLDEASEKLEELAMAFNGS